MREKNSKQQTNVVSELRALLPLEYHIGFFLLAPGMVELGCGECAPFD